MSTFEIIKVIIGNALPEDILISGVEVAKLKGYTSAKTIFYKQFDWMLINAADYSEIITRLNNYN